ncbi:MAG: class I SAM-dependent methyltransferase [Thermaerobacter sp.]|nr:hypothetical protein [Bacillota bacterium]REJ36946.1 MAG: hypothetical protein DIU84_05170 [Bacillota bacterium]
MAPDPGGWATGWIWPALAAAALWVMLRTDGRWFGKRLMYLIYDRVGPGLFAAMPETERWLALLARLDLEGGERVLDVGTAVGHLPLVLASRRWFRGSVTGVDWSPRMVERAREEALRRGLDGRARFQVADLRDGLPFADGAFDLVVCLGVLEAQPRTDRVLAELARLVAPGGRLVLSLYRDITAVLTGIDRRWYDRHLDALGFRHRAAIPFRPAHDVLVASRRPGPLKA